MMRRMAMFGLVALVLSAWAGLATGAFLRPGVNADGKSTEPVLATDPNGRVYLVWVDKRKGSPGVFFNRSNDAGSTWLETDIQIYLSPSEQSKVYEPEVWADGQGHVYAIWRVRHDGDAIWAAVSRDFGASWKPAVRISSRGTSFFPHLSADRNGRIYVIWYEEFVRTERYAVHFNTSSDRGETWLSRDVRLDPESPPGTAALPRLAHDDAGHVYVVWREARRGPLSVMFIHSADFGKTWSQPLKLNQSDHPAEVPKVATDGAGHVYVTWMDWRNGDKPDIYFTASADRGKTWLPKDIRLNTNAPGSVEAFDPQLRATRQGHVYVTWMDRRNGQPDVFFTASADHGKTWLPENLRLSKLAGDRSDARFPRLTADEGGQVWVVWADVGPLDRLYYSVSTDFAKSWLPQEVPLPALDPRRAMRTPSLGILPGGKLAVAWEERQPATLALGFMNPSLLPSDVTVHVLSGQAR